MKSSVLDKFVKNVTTGKFDDIHYMTNLTVFQIYLDLTDMDLSNFKVDLKNSYLKISEESPNIQFYVADFSMKFTLKFDFRTEPEFVQDKGDGEIFVDTTSLFIGYTVDVSEEGKPKLSIQNATLDCSNLTISMRGSAGFSDLINQIGDFLKDFVKERVNDYLIQITDYTVTPTINRLISGAYNTSYVFEDKIIANISSSVLPKFTNDDMTLFFKGEIRPEDEPILPFIHDLKVPSEIKEKGRQFQIGISDYLFNSIIYSFYKKKYLQGQTKDYFPIPASYIKLVFPQISYSDDTEIWFEGKAIEHGYLPNIQIANSTTIAQFDFETDMYAKTENPDLLLKLEATALIELNVYIKRGFILQLMFKL